MKLEKLLPQQNYLEKLQKVLNKKIVDIVLFGSFVKGGRPHDIDLAIICKEDADLIEIKKKIREIIPAADIQVLDIESVYSSLWLTLIKEGFSVKENKYLAEIYHIKPCALFKYTLSKLNNVQKVQFERGIKKVVQQEGTVLTRSVVLIPLHKKNAMIDFLKHWDVYYESQDYELLPIMRKEML